MRPSNSFNNGGGVWFSLGFVPEDYLLTLGQAINMFVVLDEMTNIKASILNDYAAYNKSMTFLKRLNDPKSAKRSQETYLFLATKARHV